MPQRPCTTPDANAPECPLGGHSGALMRSAALVRQMKGWTFALTAIFAVMAWGMLTDPDASFRVVTAGTATGIATVVLALCAFYGPVKPGLFKLAFGTAFFWAWIMVPMAGMEAWIFSQGLGLPSAYAEHGWKWTYGLSGLATVAGLRLWLLRQRLLSLT